MALTPAPPEAAAGRAGVFEGRIAPDQPVRVSLALTSAPRTHRRAVAYFRLASALGSDLVPPVVERRLGVGEVGALLAAQPAALELVRARAAVQNDGTVDAAVAVTTRSGTPAGREVLLDGSILPLTWAEQARSPAPLPGEDAGVLRGYVEMLVLDYLAGHLARRSVWVDADAHTLVLPDNTAAFPLHPDGGGLDRILRELRVVARFPRGLRERLAAFDRAKAAAVLAPAGFETWLLPPRTLIELDERRTGLLTLIEARVAEQGEAAVLCL